MKEFRAYPVDKYQIFRGKSDTNRWYVYDTDQDKYVGGSFSSVKEAKAWIEKQ